MARMYEFEISRDIVEELANDIGLTLTPSAKGNIVDNLINIADKPRTYQKALMGW